MMRGEAWRRRRRAEEAKEKVEEAVEAGRQPWEEKGTDGNRKGRYSGMLEDPTILLSMLEELEREAKVRVKVLGIPEIETKTKLQSQSQSQSQNQTRTEKTRVLKGGSGPRPVRNAPGYENDKAKEKAKAHAMAKATKEKKEEKDLGYEGIYEHSLNEPITEDKKAKEIEMAMEIEKENENANENENTGEEEMEATVKNSSSRMYQSISLLKFLLRHGGQVAKIKEALTPSQWKGWEESTLRYYFDLGLPLEGYAQDGETALTYACQQRHFQWLKRLIQEAGVNKNGVNREGKTAFILASQRVNKVFLNFLLDHGVEVNVADRHGFTALMYACRRENMALVQYLVEVAGAQLNRRDRYGKTEVMIACQLGHLPLTQYLIRQGADPTVRDKNGVSVLMYACKSGSMPLIRYLVDDLGLKFSSSSSSPSPTPIFSPSTQSLSKPKEMDTHTMSTTTSSSSTTIPNTNNDNGNANDNGNGNGKDMSTRTEDIHHHFMKGVLTRACLFNYGEMVRWLVEEAGLNVNTRLTGQFVKGKTPLMIACDNGHEDLVNYLLSQGAEVNATLPLPFLQPKMEEEKVNDEGNDKEKSRLSSTSISTSKEGLDKETLPFPHPNKPLYDTSSSLSSSTSPSASISSSTSASASEPKGKMPYMFAYERHHYALALHLLQQEGARLDEAVEQALSPTHQTFLAVLCQDPAYLSYLRYLVEEKGARIQARDHEGNTPFLLACAYGNQEMVHYLWERGASVHEVNHQKESALQFASSYGKNRIVEYLVGRGAEVNAVNKQGGTPLMMACYALRHRPMDWNERDGVLSNIKYLIDLGANIDVQDRNRRTALLHFYRSRIYYNDTLLIRKYLKLTVKKLAVLQNTLVDPGVLGKRTGTPTTTNTTNTTTP